MEQKIILFQGGTHGNFLEKYLNVGCGYNQNFDFFKNNFGSHNFENYTNKKFLCHHPNLFHDEIKNVFCYIYVEQEDLYKLTWHTYLATGEFGLNLLDRSKNFNNIFLNHINLNADHSVVSDNISFRHFEKTDNGLREYFKTSFKKSNGFLLTQESIIKNYSIENYFSFKDFYSNKFDQKLKENLNIDIKIKTNNHQIFLTRKKDIIDSEHKVKEAVDAFIKEKYYSLEDFCLYEQAYFDHLIEEYYSITLKTFYKQYPSNTFEYTVREDK
jgi:hypothetical protein